MVAGRIHRLLKLIALLQSGRVYNSTQLASECEVSRRTVFRDLRTLQESGIYVLYDEEKQSYTLPWRTIVPFKDLTFEEVLALVVLCQDLDKSIIGLPVHQFARSASTKVLSSLPDSLRENVIDAAQSISIWFPPFNPAMRNGIHYKNLLKATIEKKNIRIQYVGDKEQKSISTMLSPYHILYSNQEWFVVGRSSLDRGIKVFSLLKILKSEILEESFKKPSRFNLDRYLTTSWDPVRHSRKTIPVKIRFKSNVAETVSLMCWNESQEIKKLRGGAIEFCAQVDSLERISDWALSFGDQAEVISPRSFRNLMKERISSMMQIYSPHTRPSS
ncbi:WYL domain-containing protein [uncultured Gimesia sp.]|uniref:helix-turn-helix transcriptional regulator n=1 Tax=uncultured Gimesia sp. TaxID=1678688 RepID=UPI0030DC9527|tara:strand:+ start:91387 stop:92379 length:993 start_codon:yes stop_codon:yes gene_type:complete